MSSSPKSTGKYSVSLICKRFLPFACSSILAEISVTWLTNLSGNAKICSPDLTRIARVTAKATGKRTVKIVPFCGFDLTEIVPCCREIFVLTTFIPTPRPETWLKRSAVVKPGKNISSNASSSLNFSDFSRVIKSFSIAFSIKDAAETPRPSSEIIKLTCVPSLKIFRPIFPVSSLPKRRRVSGGSMPCATALRSRCKSGSTSASRICVSNSRFSPSIVKSAYFSSSSQVTRTVRCKRAESIPNLTILRRKSFSCISSIARH